MQAADPAYGTAEDGVVLLTKYLDGQDNSSTAVVSRESRSRPALLKKLDEALRKLGAQSVLISDLVAARVRLNSTDLECLDLLVLAGPTTAGRLAAHTGLSTGATTGVIDRLERRGFVRRKRDREDRRRVLVEVLPATLARVAPLYSPLAAGVDALNEAYDDRQLAIVVEYMTRVLEIGADHVAWLQKQPPARLPERRAGSRSARAEGQRSAERVRGLPRRSPAL